MAAGLGSNLWADRVAVAELMMDWLLESHWAANQAAPLDPTRQGVSVPLLTAETLTAWVAGGFGVLALRKPGWPPLGVFAVGVLLGGWMFRSVANLWWYY